MNSSRRIETFWALRVWTVRLGLYTGFVLLMLTGNTGVVVAPFHKKKRLVAVVGSEGEQHVQEHPSNASGASSSQEKKEHKWGKMKIGTRMRRGRKFGSESDLAEIREKEFSDDEERKSKSLSNLLEGIDDESLPKKKPWFRGTFRLPKVRGKVDKTRVTLGDHSAGSSIQPKELILTSPAPSAECNSWFAHHNVHFPALTSPSPTLSLISSKKKVPLPCDSRNSEVRLYKGKISAKKLAFVLLIASVPQTNGMMEPPTVHIGSSELLCTAVSVAEIMSFRCIALVRAKSVTVTLSTRYTSLSVTLTKYEMRTPKPIEVMNENSIVSLNWKQYMLIPLDATIQRKKSKTSLHPRSNSSQISFYIWLCRKSETSTICSVELSSPDANVQLFSIPVTETFPFLQAAAHFGLVGSGASEQNVLSANNSWHTKVHTTSPCIALLFVVTKNSASDSPLHAYLDNISIAKLSQ